MAKTELNRSTFSGAFKTGALYDLPKSSVIFNVLMNLALYMVFTAVCYYAAYPPQFLCNWFDGLVGQESKIGGRLPRIVRRALACKRMPREQVVAVCLCGAAKTQALGIPLADAMWAQSEDLTKSLIQIPILLYTMEQVFTAQFLTILFRWWLQRDKKRTSDDAESEAGGDLQDDAPDSSDAERQAIQPQANEGKPVYSSEEKAVV